MTPTAETRPDTSDMLAVHNALRTALSSAPSFVGSATGDAARRAMIANYYDNVLRFLEVHHHGEEELVFPLLVERCPDQRTLVTHAQDEHEAVIGLIAAADQKRLGWEEEGDPASGDFVDALVTLHDTVGTHLDTEEATILPIASEHLSAEEWGRLPGHAMMSFGGDKIWLILGIIREQMTPDQRAQMLANMPPPARQMWAEMGEASFDELMVEVRRPA